MNREMAPVKMKSPSGIEHTTFPRIRLSDVVCLAVAALEEKMSRESREADTEEDEEDEDLRQAEERLNIS
jgi:hypothetical protein